MFLINTYIGNIKEKQPNHPIGTLNTFLVILLYYVCLYQNIDKLDVSESCNLRYGSKSIIHFCAVYPAADLILILVSFFSIANVKKESNRLIENPEFKEYKQEAELALADILYLPQEFESDDGEEDF